MAGKVQSRRRRCRAGLDIRPQYAQDGIADAKRLKAFNYHQDGSKSDLNLIPEETRYLLKFTADRKSIIFTGNGIAWPDDYDNLFGIHGSRRHLISFSYKRNKAVALRLRLRAQA